MKAAELRSICLISNGETRDVAVTVFKALDSRLDGSNKKRSLLIFEAAPTLSHTQYSPQ